MKSSYHLLLPWLNGVAIKCRPPENINISTAKCLIFLKESKKMVLDFYNSETFAKLEPICGSVEGTPFTRYGQKNMP